MSDELKQFTPPESKEYRLEDIQNVNHKPHPYCITPKHLERNDSMYLGAEQIRKMEKEHGPMCGMYIGPEGEYTNKYKHGFWKCMKLYDEHTSDRVLFIKALVDKEVKDLENIQDYLKSIAPKMKELKIDGVAFVGPSKKKENE